VATTILANNNKTQKNRVVSLLPYLIGVLILAILPPFLPTYYLSMLTKVVIFGIFAMGLDLIHGYTGLVTLGQAAYLGVAGYTFGLLMVRAGINSFWVLVPLAILMSAITAAIIGYMALRVKGTYFLLINLAFGEMLAVVAIKWRPMTGGTDGLVGIRYPDLGIPGFTWTDFNFYYLVFILFIISYFLLYRIVNSSFGHALVGIRENEQRMMSMGYHTWVYKYTAFIIAAIFGGVAGAMFAPFYGAVVPNHLGLTTSAMVMLMVAIGTSGTLWGPVIGALVVLFLEHFSSVYAPERWPLILGGAFVISVLFLKGGIGIYLNILWRRISSQLWKS
jgi:branched-chain amino acid transport system permease protein